MASTIKPARRLFTVIFKTFPESIGDNRRYVLRTNSLVYYGAACMRDIGWAKLNDERNLSVGSQFRANAIVKELASMFFEGQN